jgi:large subunit ribosomal protein L9
VKIKLHPEVTVKVTINVARSAEEAVMQAQKGAAILKAASEKAAVEAAFGVPVEGTPEGEAVEAKKPAKKTKKAASTEEGEATEPTEATKEAKPKKPRAKKAAAE